MRIEVDKQLSFAVNLKQKAMKNIKILMVVSTFLFSGIMANAQSLKLDAKKSTIVWTGKKVMGKHYGKINFMSGSLTSSGRAYTGGEFVVDMNSITCDDLTDEGTNAQLVGHLKSDDFFGVESFPTARLVIKSGNSKGNNKYDFTGDLTIKGITQPVQFEAVLTTVNDGLEFAGTLVVDRSKFNVRYGSGSFFQNLGNNMIYDEFELEFKAFFAK